MRRINDSLLFKLLVYNYVKLVVLSAVKDLGLSAVLTVWTVPNSLWMYARSLHKEKKKAEIILGG